MSGDKKVKVVAIVGPTGVGKTRTAIEFCKLADGQIVSADSIQVYRDMNIGTAKPSASELGGVKQHLVDVVSSNVDFSVAVYQKLARQAIELIDKQGDLPVLVGGSGLYVRAALDTLDFPGQSRSAFDTSAMAGSSRQQLWERLRSLDPEAAEKIHPHNYRRVARALEIIETENKPFSKVMANWQQRESIYQVNMFGLTMDRDLLYQRINERVESMISKGLINEVKTLLEEGKLASRTSRQAIGYKEIIAYLEGEITFSQAVEEIKKKTRQFAKRQLTWFKADRRVQWLVVDGLSPLQMAEKIFHLVKEKNFIVR